MQQLWLQFEQAADLSNYTHGWLALQAHLIGSVSLAIVVMDTTSQQTQEPQYSPVALYPDGASDTSRLAELLERTLEQASGLWLKMDTGNYALSYPIKIDEQLKGAVVVELTLTDEAALNNAMQQLQWGMGWLELGFWRQRAFESKAILEQLQPAVDLFARVVSETEFKPAALALVNEIASLFSCERVSIGFIKPGKGGDRIRVEALSHSASFGQQMNLTRLIGSAMDEVVDQNSIIHWPVDSEKLLITRDHEQLAAQDGVGTILSVPLSNKDSCYGVITFERPKGDDFSNNEIQIATSIASLAGAALEDKYTLNLSLRDYFLLRLKQYNENEHWWRNSMLAFISVLVLFITFVSSEYQLNADTVLEGAVQRVVATPFDGFVEQAPVRAGDVIKRDELITLLDDKDLRLERIKWLSERNQLQKQSQDARARRDRAQVTIIDSQIEQADAELELVNIKLERTRIIAPFDGLVVSGDLSQRLGSAVRQGEELFRITPLDAYRVILQVNESRITDVKPGQQGQLVLASLPNDKFPFEIDKVTPVSTAAEGHNTFRVEARLHRFSEQLRPGMEGIGKITIDERPLIGIWTRNLREWLILKYWEWLG